MHQRRHSDMLTVAERSSQIINFVKFILGNGTSDVMIDYERGIPTCNNNGEMLHKCTKM